MGVSMRHDMGNRISIGSAVFAGLTVATSTQTQNDSPLNVKTWAGIGRVRYACDAA